MCTYVRCQVNERIRRYCIEGDGLVLDVRKEKALFITVNINRSLVSGSLQSICE